MENTALKDKIHSLIDKSDEETLQSIYQLLQAPEYTDEFKNILNEEQEAYYRNKEVIAKDALDDIIEEVLKK